MTLLKCGVKNYKCSFSKTLKSVCRVLQQAGKTSPSQEEAEITTANVLAGGHIKQVLFSGQRQQVWKHIVYVWKHSS